MEAVMISMEQVAEKLKTEEIIILSDNVNSVKMHGHNFIELVYIKKGSVLLTWNNQQTLLHEKSFFIVDFGIMHAYQPIDKEPFELINCMFLPSIIDASIDSNMPLKTIINNYLLKFTDSMLTGDPTRMCFYDRSGEIDSMMSMMLREYNEKKVAYLSLIKNYLSNILLKMMRSIITTGTYESSGISTMIKKYVAQNYRKNLRLSDIAAECHYSVPYLSKTFHAQTGQPFSSYLQQYRVQRSCRLLLETQMSVEEISFMCGYTDTNYFRYVFRSVTGKTPREYRIKMKKS